MFKGLIFTAIVYICLGMASSGKFDIKQSPDFTKMSIKNLSNAFEDAKEKFMKLFSGSSSNYNGGSRNVRKKISGGGGNSARNTEVYNETQDMVEKFLNTDEKEKSVKEQ
jgi:hypothetical protein